MPLPQTKYYNIEGWEVEERNTSGTRDKKIIISPDNIWYYFKKSIQKKGKYYKHEFWSEVIASQIGIAFCNSGTGLLCAILTNLNWSYPDLSCVKMNL